MQLCLPVFPFLSIFCSELVILEVHLHGKVQTLPSVYAIQPQTQIKVPCQRHRLALNSSSPRSPVAFMKRCTEPREVWKPMGQVLLQRACITLQKWLNLFVISTEVVTQFCTVLCRLAEHKLVNLCVLVS